MSCVLIVEDEARIRDIVRDYFVSHGLGCDLARNGAEALDLLRGNDYDAVLAHGGGCAAENRDKGAAFTVTLPQAQV